MSNFIMMLIIDFTLCVIWYKIGYSHGYCAAGKDAVKVVERELAKLKGDMEK